MHASTVKDSLARRMPPGRGGRWLAGAFVLSMLVAAAPATALAATYYVDQTHARASDANPGTEDLPWKTMYRAADPIGREIVAGDTVLVKAGTYDVSTGGLSYKPAITPVNSGLPGKPITFKAYPGHKVILDARNVIGNPAIGTYARHYVVIDGFTIVNAGDKGIVVQGAGSSSRVQGVVIQNNDISGVRRSDTDNTDGIRLHNASYTVVRNNRIHDVRNAGTHNAAGLKMYQTDHTLVENNEIYDVEAAIYDKQQGEFNTFRRNLVHDCGEIGIEVTWDGVGPNGHDDEVYENVIYNCPKGIAVKANSGGLVYNTRIFNNTIVGYSVAGLHTPGVNYASNTRFWNNIFYRTSSGASDVYTYDDPPTHIGMSNYNLFVTGPAIEVGRYVTDRKFSSLSAWQTYSGWDRNSRVADPLFVNAAANDFRLSPGSPALGAGRAGGTSAGAVVNAGAYTTGSEVIGITSSDLIPPNAPTGVTVK